MVYISVTPSVSEISRYFIWKPLMQRWFDTGHPQIHGYLVFVYIEPAEP